MCDYSLLTFPNRLAVEGERLVTYKFPTYSIGLAPADSNEITPSPQDPKVRRGWRVALKNWLMPPAAPMPPAVCVPPGALLRMSGISKAVQQELGIGPVENVTFIELSASAYEYRDAIRFRNGRRALLQDLPEGIRFDVLSLAADRHETSHFDPQEVRIRLALFI